MPVEQLKMTPICYFCKRKVRKLKRKKMLWAMGSNDFETIKGQLWKMPRMVPMCGRCRHKERQVERNKHPRFAQLRGIVLLKHGTGRTAWDNEYKKRLAKPVMLYMANQLKS